MTDREADIYYMPSIRWPTAQQVGYFALRAAEFDELCEAGLMPAIEATEKRRLALFRIGMGNNMKPFGDLA